jgi:hypothetical protein
VLDRLRRPRTARLLVHYALEEDVPLQADSGSLEGLDGSDHGSDAAFHIDGAAPPDLAIRDLGRKWRVGPRGGVSGGNDIDVPVQNQRASTLSPVSRQCAHHIRSSRVDLPAIGRAAKAAQPRLDHILTVRLGAGLDRRQFWIFGRDADELLGEGDGFSLEVAHCLLQPLHHLAVDDRFRPAGHGFSSHVPR